MKNVSLFLYLIYVFIRLLAKYVFGYGKKSVYISGKISGLPYSEVYDKFHYAETVLTQKGFFVVNPLKLAHQNTDWLNAMKIDLCMLSLCENACFHPDLMFSKGAMIEKDLRDDLKINIINHPILK